MQRESNAWILSRRAALTLAGACLVPWKSLYAGEFWDKKDPSQWTGEEIDRLTTKSPWAKSVTASYAPGSNNGGYGQQGGGYPRNGGGMGGGGIGIGGIGMGRRGGGGMGRPGGGYPQQTSNYKGTVRWESAQPILDALKTPLPDAFAKHFVIGVRDIPLIADQRNQQTQNPDDTDRDSPRLSTADSDNNSGLSKRQIDDLKMLTNLTPKGKESAQPELVKQMTPGGTYFLFGFSKMFLDFGKKDHEVEFTTQLGKLIVKAKFDPAEMLYHGNLSV